MGALRFEGRADAYLEWALHTGFRDHAMVGPPGDQQAAVGLLVEWNLSAGDPHPLAGDVPPEVQHAPLYRQYEHASLTVQRDWLVNACQSGPFLAEAARIELATPVAQPFKAQAPVYEDFMVIEHVVQKVPELALGCIDADFALARQSWFDGGELRIANMWDQEACVGETPSFGYGRVLHGSGPHRGLPTQTDLADADAYHERLGLKPLRRRATHGTHVLDLLAGPVPVRHRIAPSRDRLHAGDGSACAPRVPLPAGDAASRAPIALVQLPRYAVQDPSGRWLGRNVLDALHHILQTFDTARRTVVNVSWGPQTGPHDGSSLLEQALAELVLERSKNDQELSIVFPAGNSRDKRAHAQFRADAGGQLSWCVPPALGSPSHLEAWWPSDVASDDAVLEVTSPEGERLSARGPGIWEAAGARWGVTLVRSGTSMMALVALAPTLKHHDAAGAAPHGRWRLTVARAPSVHPVLVHVARTDHNMGAARKTRSSYLSDPQYEELRRAHTRTRQQLPWPSTVQPAGTLNGIGTGLGAFVAAGYRLSDGEPAAYSSAGPCPGRSGPDYSFPTEESRALQGVPGGGVRSGTIARLVGTSAAAPQLARALANEGRRGPLASRVATGSPDPETGFDRC